MRVSGLCLLGLLSMLLFMPSSAGAEQGADCPPIADKTGAIPHVDYEGVQHLTFCEPVTVKPGQNIIRVKGTGLKPNEPGYITRFDPELVYADGSVPPVDVIHLHHAVWLVNFNPQFAAGEEKSIIQMPRGFGWRTHPFDQWLLNDMLHDLVGKSADVYIVWRMDFVPDTSPAAASIKEVRTKWMDVAGVEAYPVFDALRRMGGKRRYTFPDQAKGTARSDVGLAQSWRPNNPVTLVGTVGHLHPGGIKTGLRVWRNGQSRALFKSWANYYEPAGAVSWDVSMTATPENWRVTLQPGDTLSVNSTYESKRADWYEVMGIMPVAYYNGTDAGGVDAFSDAVPQEGVLTHGHLAENDNHGGTPPRLPVASKLPSAPWPFGGRIGIDGFHYYQGDLHGPGNDINPPTIQQGEHLKFINRDANIDENTFHTITSCRSPCNRSTGIAYPLANGPVSFDSGQLGFNYDVSSYDAFINDPAADRSTWATPRNLDPGTYNYFCRIHPFMRGSFRVAEAKERSRERR